jgi:hypothetical protein
MSSMNQTQLPNFVSIIIIRRIKWKPYIEMFVLELIRLEKGNKNRWYPHLKIEKAVVPRTMHTHTI